MDSLPTVMGDCLVVITAALLPRELEAEREGQGVMVVVVMLMERDNEGKGESYVDLGSVARARVV